MFIGLNYMHRRHDARHRVAAGLLSVGLTEPPFPESAAVARNRPSEGASRLCCTSLDGQGRFPC